PGRSDPRGLKPTFLQSLNGTLRSRSGQALDDVPYPRPMDEASSQPSMPLLLDTAAGSPPQVGTVATSAVASLVALAAGSRAVALSASNSNEVPGVTLLNNSVASNGPANSLVPTDPIRNLLEFHAPSLRLPTMRTRLPTSLCNSTPYRRCSRQLRRRRSPFHPRKHSARAKSTAPFQPAYPRSFRTNLRPCNLLRLRQGSSPPHRPRPRRHLHRSRHRRSPARLTKPHPRQPTIQVQLPTPIQLSTSFR